MLFELASQCMTSQTQVVECFSFHLEAQFCTIETARGACCRDGGVVNRNRL